MKDQKEKNLIRFSATFYALCDSLEGLKDIVTGESKKRMTLLYNHSNNLLKDMQKKMNDQDKEMFEKGSELSHECLSQLFKCEHPELMIELMREFNSGNVRIEKDF
jgi:hypothetical protein